MTGMVLKLGFIGLMMVASATWSKAADLPDISLPAPRMEGGKPLMQVLKERQSLRSFSEKKLPLQTLSDLLWAAAGINRPESSKRTVPSARNLQIVEVYTVLQEGVYLYDAKTNCLKAVAKGDLRKLTGFQDFVSSAPLNLVFVADYSKIKGTPPEDQMLYAAAETGYISQNIYLYCASEELATVVRASVDRRALAKALNLSEQLKIILVQTVGYPKNEGR